MSDEMVIFTRTFDLLAWIVPKSTTFPKMYRSTVTLRLTDAALDFQEALFAANSRSDARRRSALGDADAELDRLRVYLLRAHRWHWLSDGQYRHVSAIVAEVGRLLGGWIRSIR